MIEQVEFTGQPSSIGDAAFYGADLWDVVIPDSVANIGAAAFTRYDESGNYLYTVENGEAVLLDYFGTQTDVVLPATIDDYALTTIGRMNVYSYQNIERLTIPASIRAYWYTEFGVFASCENLKYVKIENSADIADSMFYDCKSLEEVVTDAGISNFFKAVCSNALDPILVGFPVISTSSNDLQS